MTKMERTLATEMLSLVLMQESVFFVLQEADWDNEICHLALPLLQEDAIIDLLQKKNFHIPLLESAFRILKIAEREDEELLEFLEKTKYHLVVCEKIIPLLETKRKIYLLEKCSYINELVLAAMPMGKEEEIIFVLRKNGFSWKCCEKAIPFLREESNILFLMKKCCYTEPAVEAAKKALA